MFVKQPLALPRSCKEGVKQNTFFFVHILWIRGGVAWTKHSKFEIDGSLMVANYVSIPENVLTKFQNFLKEIS